jgi:hypothetical protein
MTTIWAIQNLVEMTKAQLVVVWSNQPREKYTDCIQPKTKMALIRSIVSFQEREAK